MFRVRFWGPKEKPSQEVFGCLGRYEWIANWSNFAIWHSHISHPEWLHFWYPLRYPLLLMVPRSLGSHKTMLLNLKNSRLFKPRLSGNLCFADAWRKAFLVSIGASNRWAMKTNHGLGYRGDYIIITVKCGLFHKPWNKDPVIKQPGFSGIRIRRALFFPGWAQIICTCISSSY